MAGQLVATPPETDKSVNFRPVNSIFSRSCYYFWLSLFFSETTGSDLSNGVGLVSVFALLKKLRGHQTFAVSTELSKKNLKISNSGQLWASNGRSFRRFPVLTHNFHQTVTRRAPSCKGGFRVLRVIRRRGQTGTNWPSENP